MAMIFQDIQKSVIDIHTSSKLHIDTMRSVPNECHLNKIVSQVVQLSGPILNRSVH